MYRHIIVIALLAVSLSSGSAMAKSTEDRVGDLERQLADIQKTYMANNQDTAAAVAKASAIQDDFNSVKGQAEAATYQLKTQREELIRLINDLQIRTQAIEDRMEVFSAQITAAIGKVAPAAASEAESYQKGLDLANNSKYLEAASAFESFMQKYPKSQFVASARKWVGDCFYSSRDYKRAIKEYQNFIEKNPKDTKVADAILKQGNSFYELGMLDESKAFYEKVISSHPGSTEANQAKAKLARVGERKAAAPVPAASPASAPGTAPAKGPGAVVAPAPQAAPPADDLGGGYPTETIEQQRQKMSGTPPPPPAKEPAKDNKKPIMHKEF